MTIRVFEAFAGYGSQSIALRNIGVNYEVVAISEIDKYTIKAYEAIHGPVNNLGDISKIKIEDVPQHDLFTYSFPCQDISVAGKRKGIEKGKTRSGLLYECEKIIEHCRPKYLLMENVKNLVGKKFKAQFDEWLAYLESLGYTNYYQVMNSKHYGIPQNRERVFCVSILDEHREYSFPKPYGYCKSVSDLLEDNVGEKYYLNQSTLDKLFFNVGKNVMNMKDGLMYFKNYDSNIEKLDSINILKNKNSITVKLPCICASRGRYIENPSARISGLPTVQMIEINEKDTSNTITTVGKDNYVLENTLRIRKLTTRETFRFMGLSDFDIDCIENSQIPITQQYKMAGNSIVVSVLEEIFKELLLK